MGQMKKPRTDEVVFALKADIEQGIYPIGEPLIQESLAQRYGVSRIPVREALKTLAAEGLIDIHPGAGTFIAVPNFAEIAEIFEIRVQLEPHLLRLSIPMLGPRDFEAAEAALNAMADGDLSGRNAARDAAFHQALFAGIDRPVHMHMLRTLRAKTAGLYADEGFWMVRRAASVDEHRGILAAVRNGNDKEASSLLIRHLMRAREALLAKVSSLS